MKGMHLTQDEHRPGRRVVAGRDPRIGLDGRIRYAAMRIETIGRVDGDAMRTGGNARIELIHAEGSRTAMLCRTRIEDAVVEDTPWRTLWTDPLPDGDDAALALVAAVYGSDGHRDVALLWIGAVGPDGIAYAHQIAERDEGGEAAVLRSASGMVHRTDAIAVRADAALEPGTLVAAIPVSAADEEGVIVHRIEDVRVLARNMRLSDAAALLEPTPGTGTGNLASLHRIDELGDEARAAAEPSEALTLCWDEGGRPSIVCLAKTGIAFWRNDDPEDYARSTIPGPGLWTWRNVRHRGFQDHEGVWDADMDGKWHPARVEDVVRMTGSVQAAEQDIQHYVGEGIEDPIGTYARMAELASVRALAA